MAENHEEMLTDLEKQLNTLEGQIEDMLSKAGDEKDVDKANKSGGQTVRFRPKVNASDDVMNKAKKKDNGNGDDMDGDEDDDEETDDDWSDKRAKDGVTKAKSDKEADVKKADDVKKTEDVKKAEKDETITVAGQEITKSVVGAAQFAIFKAQADEIAKAKEDIAKERDLRETAEMRKIADDLYAHVPGTVDERAEMLKALAPMPEPIRKSFTAVLTQAEKLAKAAFESLGTSGGRESNGAAFMTKVAEIKKRDNCKNEEAMQKARIEHPDEFKAYQAQQ